MVGKRRRTIRAGFVLLCSFLITCLLENERELTYGLYELFLIRIVSGTHDIILPVTLGYTLYTFFLIKFMTFNITLSCQQVHIH